VLLILLLLAAEAPACLEAGGERACGHHCVARFGLVRCARTSHGICWAEGGTVTCWDPPQHVAEGSGPLPPRPRCQRAGDRTACGYECLARGDEVACTQTPEGACVLLERHGVVCWDPPPHVRARMASPPRPTCVEEEGRVACGYQCLAREGELACTRTPWGLCRSAESGLTCWDP
jgi:hypothetical protein